MDTLLTVRQLQELLQVDRITIYRMLNDGRLQGFKVGGQWRFSRREIEDWLREQRIDLEAAEPPTAAGMQPSPQSLPLGCTQAIQDIFAEALGVGAITTAVDGAPLTTLSNANKFCDLILNTEAGRQRCIGAWRAAAAGRAVASPQTAFCHAGLKYVWGRIEIQGVYVAATHAGQFLNRHPGEEKGSDHIGNLAAATGVEASRLRAALAHVPILDQNREDQVRRLLQRVADTFAEIGQERQILLERLQRIAEMTQV